METPPPLNAQPPVAKPDGNEKLLIILCHLSLFLGVGLIFPLIIYLVKKGESEKIADHARESLNFHISLIIYGLVSVFLCAIFIGFPLLLALMVNGTGAADCCCGQSLGRQFLPLSALPPARGLSALFRANYFVTSRRFCF